VQAVFSDLDAQFLRVCRFVEAANLSRVQPGVGGAEVTQLLGPPLVVERGEGWQSWDYNINLPIASGDNHLVCQYKVMFDRQLEVSETDWRRVQCEQQYRDFVGSLQLLTLAADVLFEFDSAELTQEAYGTLNEISRLLINQYRAPEILVTGHTDRIGDADYNQLLSERRAQAVGEFLGRRGVVRDWMSVQGRGETDPLVICLGEQVDQALRDCLAPNRRVTVEVAERGRESR